MDIQKAIDTLSAAANSSASKNWNYTPYVKAVLAHITELQQSAEKAEAQLAQRDAQIAAIDSGLSTLAGAMLNRTLDSGSKQAVAYAECADMVAKFAKQLREGK